MLEYVRDDDWITDQLEAMWNNPEQFESDGMFEEVPDGANPEDYTLFQLGVLFGIDYEQEFPQDGDWREQE